MFEGLGASVLPSSSVTSLITSSQAPAEPRPDDLLGAVADRVAADILHFLTPPKAKSGGKSEVGEAERLSFHRRRLRFLARRSGIHEKTLTRILHKINQPTYITLFKVYRVLLSEADDTKLLDLTPKEIGAYLRQAPTPSVEKNKSSSFDLDRELQTNPVMAELYILCATGPVKTGFVKQRFGDYGLTVVETLLSRGVLQRVSANEVCEGSAAVTMSPETLLSIGVHVSRSYARPDKSYETGENFISFYAEGLTDEVYQKWLAIDADAFQKKVQLAKRPESRGPLRAFTFCVNDVLGDSK